MISRPGIGRQTLKTDTAAPLHGPCMSGAMPLQKAGNTPDETPVSALVRMRLDAVARSERLTRAGVGQTKADAQAAAAAGVAAVSVTRWRLACRGLAPEARIAVLADRPGRGRCGPLTDSQMRDCVEALIYDHGPHLTATHVVRVLAARYGKAPGLRAVQRWLKAWRAKNARALSAVTDPDGHKNKYLPAFGSRSEGVDAPNALWELDSTPADVMCADGRHAIVGVIDIWPRRAKVLVVPVSRATALCALMRRCLIDWGVPERAKTDGGADYVSRHFTRVLADLGITHDICPPYTPEAKPHIERFFGTMTRDLFAYLPGFVGHDVADRKRIEARRSMAARRGQGERETFNVSLSAAELQQKCDLWCDAIYDRRAQTGLGGQSPWERRRSSSAPLRRITRTNARSTRCSPNRPPMAACARWPRPGFRWMAGAIPLPISAITSAHVSASGSIHAMRAGSMYSTPMAVSCAWPRMNCSWAVTVRRSRRRQRRRHGSRSARRGSARVS